MRYKKLSKTLITLVLSAIIIFTVTAAKKVSKSELRKKGVINSFESLVTEQTVGDFLLETNGYVELEQFKKHKSKGRYSCKAVFSVPTDFMTTTKAAKTDTWIASITMSIGTTTKLKITDWSLYKKFNVDVYNPDEKERDFFIKLTDISGKEFIAKNPIKQGKNKLEIKLEDVKNARIDTSNITAISLYLDNAKEEKDVTLFIDYLRITP